MIAYSGKLDAAPKPEDVVGELIEPTPFGGMDKMVRVEETKDSGLVFEDRRRQCAVISTIQSIAKQKISFLVLKLHFISILLQTNELP